MILRAETAGQLDSVRGLFAEYADAFPVRTCDGNFGRECGALPGDYAPPRGELLLALVGDEAAGCIALKPVDRETCEMKRFYLRPAFRGRGLGRELAEAIVEAARRIGYRRMRLDTLASMKAAIGIYRSIGFRVSLPYRDIPIENAVFMELAISPR